MRERFHRCFEHEWETGLAPDEVNYDPGDDAARPHAPALQRLEGRPDARARRCWPSGPRAFGAALGGLPGLRLIQDNMIWKPPSGKALLCHQDAAYLEFLDAEEHDDVLDGARRHARRHRHDLLRARLQPLAARRRRAARSTRPTTGSATCATRCPTARSSSSCRSRCRPAARRSTTAGRSTAARRTSAPTPSAARSSRTWSRPTRRWSDGAPHPVYSRYRRPGERELDEAFFPVMWRQDGHRTGWLDALTTAPGSAGIRRYPDGMRLTPLSRAVGLTLARDLPPTGPDRIPLLRHGTVDHAALPPALEEHGIHAIWVDDPPQRRHRARRAAARAGARRDRGQGRRRARRGAHGDRRQPEPRPRRAGRAARRRRADRREHHRLPRRRPVPRRPRRRRPVHAPRTRST